MLIGGATINTTPLDWEGNLNKIVAATREARSKGIRLLCFPELCLSGYGCEDWFLSDWVPATALNSLLTLVPETTDITICVGLPLRIETKTYNGVAVVSNGQILGITCKQNLALDGVHYEPRWFTAWSPNETVKIPLGDQIISIGDLIYEVEGVRFGFEICEDGWRKSNRPGYRLLDRKVDLIFNPSASHFAMKKSLLRESEVVLDGSQLFHCAYVFVNLTGNEAGRMIYDGDIIIAQHGKLLAVADRFSFESYRILAIEIDFENSAKSEVRTVTDSRVPNEEVSKALALGLFDYLRKSKAKGFVVSLSGGADSSMCATVVGEMVRQGIEALGLETFSAKVGYPGMDRDSLCRTLLACAYQGTSNSSTDTLQSAETLARSLGANFYNWSIENLVTENTRILETALQTKLTWQQHDIPLQNIQARTRSPLIWFLANLKQAVLLTTSNRSEGDVGYATMDGDTSGSLAPIAGLTKPFILQWLKWAEANRGYTGLEPVNSLTPTAELRPPERHQTDEADLMPYPLLAAIEREAIYHKKDPVQVYVTLKETWQEPDLKRFVIRFFKLWASNQWKRERLAPSFHLDDMNVDPRTWCRFPILSSAFQAELNQLELL